MKYYFAPMEGITGYVYRSVHHKFFSGIDKYFTPFLSPGPKKVLTDREIRDILPQNNPQMYVVPQILTNGRRILFVWKKSWKAMDTGKSISISAAPPAR